MGNDLKRVIRDIPNFPKEGVLFRDITTILHNPDCLNESIEQMIQAIDGVSFDFIAGPESRGFIFGVPIAQVMHKGFIPVRKAGKLPFKTVKRTYDLEYGTATIEMHSDAIKKGDKIVIVDDLLATGGTCKALCELIEEVGGEVAAIVFFIELKGLNGRKELEQYNVHSIVKYD